MTTWRVVMISVWLFGCTLASAPRDDAGAANDRPPVTSWIDVMGELDDACSQFSDSLLQKPPSDLGRAAQRAQAAAALMRLGYGKFEDRAVPGFAGFAREAESWLLQIAIEARQGHGDIAADLFRNGRRQHCNRCHEAHERVYG